MSVGGMQGQIGPALQMLLRNGQTSGPLVPPGQGPQSFQAQPAQMPAMLPNPPGYNPAMGLGGTSPGNMPFMRDRLMQLFGQQMSQPGYGLGVPNAGMAGPPQPSTPPPAMIAPGAGGGAGGNGGIRYVRARM